MLIPIIKELVTQTIREQEPHYNLVHLKLYDHLIKLNIFISYY